MYVLRTQSSEGETFFFVTTLRSGRSFIWSNEEQYAKKCDRRSQFKGIVDAIKSRIENDGEIDDPALIVHLEVVKTALK